ncbi:MAG: hypothetical protein ABIN17_03735 [candidate division WOR-3 bacterium]
MRLKGSFLFLSFIFLLSVYKASKVEACPDFFWYLMDGKYFVENHKLPQNDYIFLPQEEWIAHSLYFESLLYLIYKKFGDKGVYFLKNFLLSLLFFLIIYLIKRKTQVILNFLIIYIPIYTLFFWGTMLRPHIFTYLSTILILIILEKEIYFLTIPVLTFFSLFHAGIIAPIGICVIYILNLLIKKNFKKTIILFIYTILSITLIIIFNPYHLKYFEYIYKAFTEKIVIWSKYITEWETIFIPVLIEKNFYYIISFIFILFLLTIFLISPSKKEFYHALLIILFFYFSLKHVRNIPLFATISTFIIPSYFNKISKFKLKFDFFENKIFLKIFLLIINIFLVIKIFLQEKKIFIDENFFPVKAALFLKNKREGGNILCPSDRGGFVEYFLYPEFKIAVDGRLSVKTQFLEEFFKFWNLEINPETYIKKYKPNFILTENKMILTKKLLSIPYLKVIYKDENFTIFELK